MVTEMIMYVSGWHWEYAGYIYRKVGENRFQSNELGDEYPDIQKNLRSMVDCGILIKYRKASPDGLHMYHLSPGAVEKIRKFDKEFACEETT